MTVTISCPAITPRLRYVLDFVFKRIGLNYEVSISEAPRKESMLFYGYKVQGLIPSKGLLFEKEIRPLLPEQLGKGEEFLLFPVEGSEFGFDVFSAVFYMLSRYEEYIAPKSSFDQYDRFMGIESLTHKAEALKLPVVDIWIERLHTFLAKSFPGIPAFRSASATFIPSFDIDHILAFKGRSFGRKILKVLSGLRRGGMREFGYRLGVAFGKKKDPYDTFDKIASLHAQGPEALFFLLIGQHGGLDNALPTFRKEVRLLVDKIKKSGRLHLHPSFHSRSHHSVLQDELEQMKNICGKEVRSVRQHYLAQRFPETYRSFWEKGVKEDYSMAFPDLIGFRNGTSHPSYFYDLQLERETDLLIYPCCLMDATLAFYQKLSPTRSMEEIKEMSDVVKRFGGYFIPIWHNNTLSEYAEWKGWSQVYEYMLNLWKDV